MIHEKQRNWIAGALLILSIGAAIVSSWIAASRQLSALEAALTQLFVLSFGLLSSFMFGQMSAEHAGRILVRSHARSAFRRLLSLYQSLSRVATIVEEDRAESNGKVGASTRITLEKVEAIVIEQIATADDAMNDWKDICPEDVEQVMKRLVKRSEQANE